MKKILFSFVVSILGIMSVNASSCTLQEQSNLSSKAANVKVNYEAIRNFYGDESAWVIEYDFKINILNITEDTYVVITNDSTKESKTFNYSDTDNGTVSFTEEDDSEVVNYTIVVYSSSNTNCVGEKYKTLYLTTPRYNFYSGDYRCSEYPDFSYCQELVTTDEIDDSGFYKRLENYKKENNLDTDNEETTDENRTLFDKIFTFIDNNKYYIIGTIVIVGGAVFYIYRKKTKKQRDLGL